MDLRHALLAQLDHLQTDPVKNANRVVSVHSAIALVLPSAPCVLVARSVTFWVQQSALRVRPVRSRHSAKANARTAVLDSLQKARAQVRAHHVLRGIFPLPAPSLAMSARQARSRTNLDLSSASRALKGHIRT